MAGITYLVHPIEQSGTTVSEEKGIRIDQPVTDSLALVLFDPPLRPAFKSGRYYLEL